MAAAISSHAILVRPGAYNTKVQLITLMNFITLEAYGDWIGEMEEIKRKYGWLSVEEVGKFYPAVGHDWYFYVYGSSTSSGKLNQAAAAFEGGGRDRKTVLGDIIVIKSGPRGSKYDPMISYSDLADAILFNRDAQLKSETVWQNRERDRALKRRDQEMKNKPKSTKQEAAETPTSAAGDVPKFAAKKQKAKVARTQSDAEIGAEIERAISMAWKKGNMQQNATSMKGSSKVENEIPSADVVSEREAELQDKSASDDDSVKAQSSEAADVTNSLAPLSVELCLRSPLECWNRFRHIFQRPARAF